MSSWNDTVGERSVRSTRFILTKKWRNWQNKKLNELVCTKRKSTQNQMMSTTTIDCQKWAVMNDTQQLSIAAKCWPAASHVHSRGCKVQHCTLTFAWLCRLCVCPLPRAPALACLVFRLSCLVIYLAILCTIWNQSSSPASYHVCFGPTHYEMAESSEDLLELIEHSFPQFIKHFKGTISL